MPTFPDLKTSFHSQVVFEDVVEDEHDELPERRGCSRGYYGNFRILKPKAQEQCLSNKTTQNSAYEAGEACYTHFSQQVVVQILTILEQRG